MTDTLYADVSEFQTEADNRYPYRFIAFRSNDGTYRDHHFAQNLAWAAGAVSRKRLAGYMVYFVWEENWQATFDTFKAALGAGHRARMAVMIDVESWGGKIRGDHSAGINNAREAVIHWLHAQRPAAQRKIPLVNRWYLARDRRRVVGYGNAGDLTSLWPHRGDARVVLANYSANPSFPGKIAHQFSSSFTVPPFGRCDINSADGRTPAQFVRQLGLGVTYRAPAKPAPITHAVQPGDTFDSIAKQWGVTTSALMAANPRSATARLDLIYKP